MRVKKLDLKGKRFGRLIAIKEAGRAKNGAVLWECKCDCGNIKICQAAGLKSGGSKSCGCIKDEGNHTTHGKTYSSEYRCWGSMIQRCTNPNKKDFKYYGGRGITVCDQWVKSFENFYKDMGPRPSLKHTIDRIDNDLGYFKDNCRWATKTEQLNNRGMLSTNTSGVEGVNWSKSHKKWHVRLRIDGKRKTVGYFDSFEGAADALNRAITGLQG